MALSDAELGAVADELETVASWHNGARAQKVLALAAQLRGETPPTDPSAAPSTDGSADDLTHEPPLP